MKDIDIVTFFTSKTFQRNFLNLTAEEYKKVEEMYSFISILLPNISWVLRDIEEPRKEESSPSGQTVNNATPFDKRRLGSYSFF